MNSKIIIDTRIVFESSDLKSSLVQPDQCLKQVKWGRSDQKQKLSFRDYALKLETMLASLLAVFLLVFFRNEIVSLCSFAFEMCGGEAVLEIVDILVLLVFCGWFVAYSNGEYGRLKKRDWQRFRSEFMKLYHLS